MQLVSFTACLLGILTLLSYCSFTLTCRSQGSELDSVSRRLELWHCPSWLSESRKEKEEKRREEPFSHPVHLSFFIKKGGEGTNKSREMGAVGRKACFCSGLRRMGMARGDLLCASPELPAQVWDSSRTCSPPSSSQQGSIPCGHSPRSLVHC